jgi:SynChlorMet cassette protein ScmC
MFVPTKGTETWVNKLASVMGLKPCEQNGIPKLIFVRDNLTENKVQELMNSFNTDIWSANLQTSWKFRKFDSLNLWYSYELSDIVYEFDSNQSRSEKVNRELDVWRMWHVLYPVYEQVQSLGGLSIHAALIERYGNCVMISAPGGTGKSTCCERIPSPWHAICDDESLIVLNKQEKYVAHPIPTWSFLFDENSKSWNTQQYFPLKAIFFLEQSENDEVIPIGQGQSAILIADAVSWIWARVWKNINDQEKSKIRKEVFDNACQLAKTIPAFKLRASLTGKFWEEMEKTLESI